MRRYHIQPESNQSNQREISLPFHRDYPKNKPHHNSDNLEQTETQKDERYYG
jgi:hypothetical protein